MTSLNIKPTHKPIEDYYDALDRLDQLGFTHETAVRSAFQSLLQHYGQKLKWTLVPEHSMTPLIRGARGVKNRRIVIDGALIDSFQLSHGYWEAKDIHDNLPIQVQRKFDAGYPRDNILFQTPKRAILWQNDQRVLDADLTDSAQLIETLQTFFSHRPQAYVEWETAVTQFKDKVPALGKGLAELIEKERETSRQFATAFRAFHEKCCQSINPDLSEAAVEEMLIQHLLTERLFRTVFDNPDFPRRNVIANEIEKVIDALTSHSFSRDGFLQSLDRFYISIEDTARTISDFSQKQGFLNTVYEQFFQGFSVKIADTHGVVYTPQPIVDFMVRSVEEILGAEFNRSLSDSGVHIIDPFVGTGNFIVRIMREIQKTALEDKYQSELHCNEVMLLPYYIAAMNIEHEFFEGTSGYHPFEGICLVDTFELAEDRQLPLFALENTRRVEEQKKAPMFVVIGNPPYNVGQVNENDNSKNRKYPTMDARVKETYAKDSTARNKNQLSDPYVKAIRWASDRIGEEGVVAFVTNNSFLDGVAFDGMRKHLERDFTKIYHINLKGNARTSGERRRKESGNIFNDQIRVGVGISFFIRKADVQSEGTEVCIYSIDDYLKARDKQEILTQFGDYTNVPMKQAIIDAKHTWLTEGLHTEFEIFIPMGTQEAKEARGETVEVIFKHYGRGVATSRDAWVYNFNRNALAENMERLIESYNEQVFKWEHLEDRNANVDDFVAYDDTKISWSRDLKLDLKRGRTAEYVEDKVRNSLYRPFTESNLFFDRVMNEEVYVFPSIFPIPETETENRVICLTAVGNKKTFHCLMTQQVADLHLTGDSQCFPFYTYDEDGRNRRENITDWALEQYRAHYRDEAIGKWDIFHYVYGLLHHPTYRKRYQANLKRDLPHLPYAPNFWDFAKAGQRLGEIHIGYEDADEYRMKKIETPGKPLDWRVEKMRLSKDKTQIKYNDFLALDGIPAKAFDYRLGNRSALEWVIDQYRIKTDKRSGIVNDPNREDAPQYIVKLIGKVITVSLETVEIVEKLPNLGLPAH